MLNVVKPAWILVGGSYGGLQFFAAECNWISRRGEFPVLVIPLPGRVFL
jgi:hypothetical protein